MKQKQATLYIFFFLLLNSVVFSQSLSKLPDSVNTKDKDEILPVLNREGDVLMFTRVGEENYEKVLLREGHNLFDQSKADAEKHLQEIFTNLGEQPGVAPSQSVFNQDIMEASLTEGTLEKVYHPSYPLNNALPNSVLAYIAASNSYIVNNVFFRSGGMDEGVSLVQKNSLNEWSFPQAITIDGLESSSNSFSMCSNQDGTVFIFSLDRMDSKGQTDLYVSFKNNSNTYSRPQHIKNWINTDYKETNPTLSSDGKTLFFSSNRPGSQGMDIYYSRRLSDSWLEWTSPQKLEAPINTGADESQPQIDEVNGLIYFTSNRDGSMDIFTYPYEVEKEVRIDISGMVIETRTNKPLRAMVKVNIDGKDTYRNISVNSSGRFMVDIPTGKLVRFSVNKHGYFPLSRELFIGQSFDKTKEIRLELSKMKIERGREKTVLFEQGSLDLIDPQSTAYKVDEIINKLKRNPRIKVIVEGHTDNMGEWSNLLTLSKNRAILIKNLLIEKGANPERIQIAAYGSDRPLNSNDTEKARAQNRRVAFRIEEIK